MATAFKECPMSNQAPFHARSAEDVLREFEVDPARGLSNEKVHSARETFGPNELDRAKRRSVWQILIEQFKSVVIIIMGLAAIAALVTAQWTEAIAILAVVIVNAAIGFFAEYKAARSMEALRKLGARQTVVRRAGKEQEVETVDLVPGDILVLKEGSLIPADARIIETNNLRVTEAALTGESVPANKTTEAVDAEAPLAERLSLLFKGTSIADGEAVAVVVATGTETELGRISQLTNEAESNTAPLQERLDQLGRRLAYITIGVAIVVAISGLIAGRETMLMIETSIALGVAAIPEGLPIVATIALARGMWLMSKRNALVNRLTAVETLGATRVIFTDKTGTLTENKMQLHTLASCDDDMHLGEEETPGSSEFTETSKRIIRISVLCNGASLGSDENKSDSGDPTELALLQAGRNHGLDRDELLKEMPEEQVIDFDTDTMMMATYHRKDNQYYVAVKGAPQRVVDSSTSFIGNDESVYDLDDPTREHWNRRVDQLAAEGLRVLAVAEKQVDSPEAEAYENLCLVGLVGLLDPPRREVRDSIHRCQSAGIRVLMVTGDQPTTGQAIGKAVGIGDRQEALAMHGSDLRSPEEMSEEQQQRVIDTAVFARVSPEQKLDLVDFYQKRGEPVAMTGDGVNDTPALKKADIGIAMGKRGTEAAKQTADMILQDDSFETIVAAVEQGRIIFGNIRKSVVFMLCTNVAEILAVTVASLAGLPLPLRPLQILYLNVVTDVFPALALGIGRGQANVMDNPPRKPDEAVLTKHLWTGIVGWSIVVASFVMTALMVALMVLGYEQSQAITVSFMTLGFAKLFFVLNLRDPGASRFNNDITKNGWLWTAVGLCVVLLIVAVYLPGLSTVLNTAPPTPLGWATILALAAAPAIIGLFVPPMRFHGQSMKEAEASTSDS